MNDKRKELIRYKTLACHYQIIDDMCLTSITFLCDHIKIIHHFGPLMNNKQSLSQNQNLQLPADISTDHTILPEGGICLVFK